MKKRRMRPKKTKEKRKENSYSCVSKSYTLPPDLSYIIRVCTLNENPCAHQIWIQSKFKANKDTIRFSKPLTKTY